VSVDLRPLIDHTLLAPDATPDRIVRLCREAIENQFATVCVNPVFASLCAKELSGSPVGVCTVVGFPLGANLTEVKVYEALRAVEAGAREIDMVLPIGLLKAGDHAAVARDIAAVVVAAEGRLVKVILETALLTREEKAIGCLLAERAGAAFVKTSTGFGPGGATVEDVRLLRASVGPAMGVKASGGIRTREQAVALVEAGATRLGTSASLAIVPQES
jgi:deoxyribose-phosphate aldolase